jgi:uncharacterized phage protein (TIGR01671 family)
MREILFRGKRKDGRGWAYGFYIRTRAFEYIHCYDREEFSDSVFTCHAIIPETAGQYTGIKDRNGNRIFEGDLVEVVMTGYEPWKGDVIFSGDQWRIGEEGGGVQGLYMFHRVCSVIGNIHDTPELLKEAQ